MTRAQRVSRKKLCSPGKKTVIMQWPIDRKSFLRFWSSKNLDREQDTFERTCRATARNSDTNMYFLEEKVKARKQHEKCCTQQQRNMCCTFKLSCHL